MFSSLHNPIGGDSAAGLGELLFPITPQHFLEEFWEKKALYVPRHDLCFYQSLFSLKDFDSLLSYTAPRYPEVRAFNKRPEAAEEFIGTGWLEGEKHASISGLYGLYERGSVIQVHNMQNRWQPIGSLCRRLEAAFHSPVDVNAYLLPGNDQGFRAHYDSYATFVVQIHGSKRWQVYPLPLEYPENQTGIAGTMPEGTLGSPVFDVLLQAGDMLYLPRGWGHATGISPSPSLYLSIMVHVYCWKDILSHALSELSDADIRFRKALPIGFAERTDLSSDEEVYFEELLGALRENARIRPARERLNRSFLRSLQPVADGHFAHVSDGAKLVVDTALEKRPGVLCHVASSGDRATIYFPGDEVSGPSRIEPSLQFIAQVPGRFTSSDLPKQLNEVGKLVLLRRLVSAGLLRFAD
jgi:ribosomal protein L16 Arg81 hydroxylase